MLITLGWLRVGWRQPVLIVVTRWLIVSLIADRAAMAASAA